MLQESVQVIQIGRSPGAGKLFDLFVDAMAITVAMAWVARRGKAHAAVSEVGSPKR